MTNLQRIPAPTGRSLALPYLNLARSAAPGCETRDEAGTMADINLRRGRSRLLLGIIVLALLVPLIWILDTVLL